MNFEMNFRQTEEKQIQYEQLFSLDKQREKQPLSSRTNIKCIKKNYFL